MSGIIQQHNLNDGNDGNDGNNKNKLNKMWKKERKAKMYIHYVARARELHLHKRPTRIVMTFLCFARFNAKNAERDWSLSWSHTYSHYHSQRKRKCIRARCCHGTPIFAFSCWSKTCIWIQPLMFTYSIQKCWNGIKYANVHAVGNQQQNVV